MRARFLVGLLLSAGCDGATTDRESGGSRGCNEVLNDVSASLASLQQCSSAADCGTVLTGTSCGCTRDLVARADADTAEFYALLDEAQRLGCDPGFTSTCDCPDADGYDCVSNTCTWNYVR